MAVDKQKKGFSLSDEDAIETGLFASGPFKIAGSEWAMYDYGGSTKGVPVWLITFERGSGKERESYEQPYSLGKGWDIDRKGNLVAKAGQTGLPKSCNAIVHLVKPLRKALAAAGIDEGDAFVTMDPSFLVGLEGEVERVEQQKRDIKENGRERRPARDNDQPKTILEIHEVTSAPWAEGEAPKKGKGKAKAEPEDADEDDEEEDEKPAKSSKAPAKGKASKKAEADDEDEDEGESDAEADTDDVTEEAVEAVMALVERGAVDVDDLEAKLTKMLKGNKQAAGIIDLATSPKFLKREQGWSFDAKKGVLEKSEE